MTNKTDLTTLALGGAAIGAAAFLGYEAITYFLNPAGGATKQCSAQQTTCYNDWLAAMQSYQVIDSANGTSITVEQQSFLNEYMACVNNAQANCLAAYKSLDVSPTAILGNMSAIIADGIAAAIVAYGLGKALGQLKSKTKPPTKGTGMTWAEAMAFMLTLMVQTNVNNGKVSTTFAESFRTYAPETLSPLLTQSAKSQIALLQEQSIITAEVAATMATVAEAAIATDIALSVAIIAVA